jgi:hypothetical protein
MGVDREAMDIWKFGRPRPDLTLDESLAAPMPEFTPRQIRAKHKAISKFEQTSRAALTRRVLADYEIAKAAGMEGS